MRFVIQRVSKASVTVENEIVGNIEKGLLVLIGIEDSDSEEIADKLVKKVINLRIFEDENGKTNLSVKDVGGEILLVSQFTLAGDCEHGNRPSFSTAETPERANELYLRLKGILETEYNLTVKTGVFGAEMIINQVNDGPFTVFLQK